MTESEPLGHRPPPPWYGWTIKLSLAWALLFIGAAFLLQQVYQGPTLARLSKSTDTEKQQDACYDALGALVTDGNAAVLASLTVSIGAIGDLVVALAAPPPRDQATVAAIIGRIGAASKRTAAASGAYDVAIDARKAWVAAERPLPCPVPS